MTKLITNKLLYFSHFLLYTLSKLSQCGVEKLSETLCYDISKSNWCQEDEIGSVGCTGAQKAMI